MTDVQAIFFDLDETLLDSTKAGLAITSTCEWIASERGIDSVEVLQANAKMWGIYWPEVVSLWTLGGLSDAEVRLEAWRRTLEACGRSDESLALAASEMASHHFDEVTGALMMSRSCFARCLVAYA